jgi:hypothetical protein
MRRPGAIVRLAGNGAPGLPTCGDCGTSTGRQELNRLGRFVFRAARHQLGSRGMCAGAGPDHTPITNPQRDMAAINCTIGF